MGTIKALQEFGN